MAEIKVILSERPKRKVECPLYRGYPEFKCSIGGDCTSYDGDAETCDKIMSLNECLHNE